MGYPQSFLSTRAIVKPGIFAVIPKEGLVNNVIPNIVGGKVSILCSPKIGASFVQYVIEADEDCHTLEAFAREEGIESFLYIIEGELSIEIADEKAILSSGGYAYAPSNLGIGFKVKSKKARILLYKQRYISYKLCKPYPVIGNINDVEYRVYDEMSNVLIKDFLPTDDLAFDMNMHILSFKPGGCHPFVETHVQEHGMYILNGEGAYLIEEAWMGIKKDDFIWMGAYCQQAAYGVGREDFTYIYSKDCNRDVML